MPASRGTGLLRLLKEARRRKVYTVAVAYVALTLVLLQLGEPIFNTLFPSDAALAANSMRVLTVLLLLGFPVVMVLAWIFDIGPEGVHRTAAAEAPAGATTSAPRAAPSLSPANPPAASARMPAPPPARARAAVPQLAVADVAPDPQRVARAALAHVRHELKTPIGAIMGYSELLLEDVVSDDAMATDLRRINQAGRQLLALVDEILDVDRGGNAEADLAAFGERIRAALRDPITAVIGYCELLTENVGPDSGSLVRDLERIRSAALRLLDMSTDIVQLGTGTEGAASGLGRASAMTEGVLAKLRPLDSAPQERQGVLLIVDDNPLNRDLLSRQLARRGYEVAMADSGPAALQLLDEQNFDLVLLDILMPVMDGVEVLRRIRAQSRLDAVPVIMTSSMDEIDTVVRCLQSGAADYVTKPFDPTLLDARIETCLELSRLRQREEYFRAQVAVSESMIERLLVGTLPAAVAQRVRSGQAHAVDVAVEATVLWCDLERLLRGAARSDAVHAAAAMRRVVDVLHVEARRHEVEVVALQGSGVLLAAGIPSPCEDHAARVAATASAALQSLLGTPDLGALRFGLHTGPAAGAVLGEERLVYHVWGDAPDMARRLEASAEHGTIHLSPAAHAALRERVPMQDRGVTQLGERQMRTYILTH